jgi:hypothetical protein
MAATDTSGEACGRLPGTQGKTFEIEVGLGQAVPAAADTAEHRKKILDRKKK